MEKQPNQEYRDELAEELNDIRKSDPQNPEIARAEARGYLKGVKRDGDYQESERYHERRKKALFLLKDTFGSIAENFGSMDEEFPELATRIKEKIPNSEFLHLKPFENELSGNECLKLINKLNIILGIGAWRNASTLNPESHIEDEIENLGVLPNEEKFLVRFCPKDIGLDGEKVSLRDFYNRVKEMGLQTVKEKDNLGVRLLFGLQRYALPQAEDIGNSTVIGSEPLESKWATMPTLSLRNLSIGKDNWDGIYTFYQPFGLTDLGKYLSEDIEFDDDKYGYNLNNKEHFVEVGTNFEFVFEIPRKNRS